MAEGNGSGTGLTIKELVLRLEEKVDRLGDKVDHLESWRDKGWWPRYVGGLILASGIGAVVAQLVGT